MGALFVAPGAPWQNGYAETFNARFRDELLDRELLGNLVEARVVLEAYRRGTTRRDSHKRWITLWGQTSGPGS
ncbi:MAG: hypothetical protein CMN30_18815 [Sandaracinus sp.]|nr:hypothetical protein [Sandaracinus sp.]